MTLPFNNIIIFLSSFYGIFIISLFAIKSINIAIHNFQRGLDNA